VDNKPGPWSGLGVSRSKVVEVLEQNFCQKDMEQKLQKETQTVHFEVNIYLHNLLSKN